MVQENRSFAMVGVVLASCAVIAALMLVLFTPKGDTSTGPELAIGDRYTVDSEMLTFEPAIWDDEDIVYKGLTPNQKQLLFRDDNKQIVLVDAKIGATFTAYGDTLEVTEYDPNTGLVSVGHVRN